MKQYYPSDWERRCSGGVYASLTGGCCRRSLPVLRPLRRPGLRLRRPILPIPHARPHGAHRSPGDPRA